MELQFPSNQFSLKEACDYMKMLEDHFNYSIKDIKNYDELTNKEKSIISRECFEKFTKQK